MRKARPSPDANSGLVALLRRRRDEIVGEWIERVRNDPRIPSANRLDEQELRDHLPELLDVIVCELEAAVGGKDGPVCSPGQAARQHAQNRMRNGYRPGEEHRELGILRATIRAFCAARGARLDRAAADALDCAIDESMAVAMDEIARAWREGRAALEDERRAMLESERAARSDAERAAQLRDEFVGVVSHELRTPLNAILGWTAMLRNGKLSGASAEKALEVVERNARAQAELVEDLLDMSRIASGKLRLDVRGVDLAGIVENALASHVPAAESKGVRLEKLVEECRSTVQGDPGRLEQIVSNLLSNAIKFTPAGGVVSIACRVAGARIEVVVQDTGRGIAPEFLPHIFDRFRQADASLTRQHRGLGLGLSLVKFLVEQHGGNVRAESLGEGKGATFTVSLPLAAVGAEVPSPIEAREALRGVRVLVVDDEEDARELLRRVLSDSGTEVATAGSAPEALAQLPRFHPDVLVSDIGMPELDGYDLLRAVRALPPEQGGATPAVALTAFARPEDRLRALRAGYQMHLVKPVDQNELVVVLANVTGRLDTFGQRPS